jgi:hypothetical protein
LVGWETHFTHIRSLGALLTAVLEFLSYLEILTNGSHTNTVWSAIYCNCNFLVMERALAKISLYLKTPHFYRRCMLSRKV